MLQSSDPDDSDKPFLTLDQSRITQGFWTSAVPDGFSHTIQILASGKTPQPDFRNAYQTQLVLDGILDSAKSGKWVEVNAG